MQYVIARFEQHNENIGYRAYVTDILQALAARNGIEVSERWYDIAYSDSNGLSEAEQAINNFYSDFRGGD